MMFFILAFLILGNGVSAYYHFYRNPVLAGFNIFSVALCLATFIVSLIILL